VKGKAVNKIRSHNDLEVFKRAFTTAMEVFQASKGFPKDETYSLTDQVRRSSRSVCANIVEAWRKRRYDAAFISKLSDAETEAAETQLWLQFAVNCGYLDRDTGAAFYRSYDAVITTLVGMMNHPETWVIKRLPPHG
jgi:four helix bundle protein